jgi:hypothetical protein
MNRESPFTKPSSEKSAFPRPGIASLGNQSKRPPRSHSRAKLSLDRPQMRKRVTRHRCSRSLRVYGGVLFLTLSSLEQFSFRESLTYPCLLARDKADGCFARGAATHFELGFERRAPTLSPMQRRLSATMSVECFKAALLLVLQAEGDERKLAHT